MEKKRLCPACEKNEMMPRSTMCAACRAKQDTAWTGNRVGDVVSFVARYNRKNGRPPTLREIAAGVGCSSGYTTRLIQVAVKDGRLLHVPGSSRSLRVPPPDLTYKLADG